MSRTLIHLSDLHFSWIEPGVVEPLIASITDASPDVVCVSGDLTQNAFPSEFEQVVGFLEQMPGHLLVVPGNHDMAFRNPIRRVTQRLRLYRKYITADLQPWYADDEIVIQGLNTARVSHLRNGRLRTWQVDLVEEKMNKAPEQVLRVLVTHHPFDLPSQFAAGELLGRGKKFMERITKCVDVLLAGHMHISHSGPTAARFKIEGQSAIFVQAGTATSIRGRGEPNSYQVLRTTPGHLEVTTMHFDSESSGFTPFAVSRFRRSPDGWIADAELTPEISEAKSEQNARL